MGAGAAAGKAGEKPAAEGRPEATPVAEKIEQGLRDMAGRMGEEAGVELNEEQKKKTADAMGKGITDFFELARQRRNGDITDEEFREKAQELREQTMKGLEGTIGPEQMEKIRKRMEEMRNRRRPGGGDPGGAGGGGGDEAF